MYRIKHMKNNSFPPPQANQDDQPARLSIAYVLGAFGGFIIQVLLLALLVNGLYVIARDGGVISWNFKFIDVLAATALVQFIRVYDRVNRRTFD